MTIDSDAVTAYADALAVVRGGVTGSLKELDFAEATKDIILKATVLPTELLSPPGTAGGPVTGTGGLE